MEMLMIRDKRSNIDNDWKQRPICVPDANTQPHCPLIPEWKPPFFSKQNFKYRAERRRF